MVVRLEVWIVTQLSLYKAHSLLQLIHISKSQCEEVSDATGSLHDHSSGVKVCCGKHSYWLLFTLKSALKYHWACITVCGEVWGLALWMAHSCPNAGCARLFLLSCPQRPKQHHTRAIALWQHICLIFLAHLPWPVSVIIMCECVCCVCLSGF